MLRKIRLYGSLAKFVGAKVLEADVSSAAEAVRFLVTNFEGLEQHMADKYYKVITHTALVEDELHDITNVDAIKIVPVVQGARGPVSRIILGVALIGISFIIPFGALLAPAVVGLGASLVLGGIAQLITPVPKIGQGENSITDTKRSYNFSGIQQTSRAGTPVPLVYGKTLVGSVVISAGITDQVPTESAAPPAVITQSGTTLTAPYICEPRSIQWLRNGQVIPGATGRQYTLQPEDYEQQIVARIICYGATTHIDTEIYTPPFNPTAFGYWRAKNSQQTFGWFPTSNSLASFTGPGCGPPCKIRPCGSQQWFCPTSMTVNNNCSVGGFLFSIDYYNFITNNGGPMFNYYGGMDTYTPWVNTDPVVFEFSNNGIDVLTSWAGRQDNSPPL